MGAGPFRKSTKFAPQADTAPVQRKSRPENVGHLYKFGAFTNRALALDRPTHLARCSNEFGMGVAHLAVVENTPSIVSQY
jgi:hypothetical protein